MDDLISIIIPVHNTETFLEECLRSAEVQTYRNTEIIVLEDGSTDNSAEICRKHAATDSRIRLVQFDEQKGPGCRRNQGIQLAKGKYLAFLDSDDVMAPAIVSTLYSMIQKYHTDIAVCGQCTDHQFCTQAKNPVSLTDGKGAVNLFLTDLQFGAFSWNKLFSAELMRRSGKYPEGMLYEDIVYIPQVCANAEKIAITDQRLYYYRQQQNSTTVCRFCQSKMDQVRAYDMLVPILLKRFPELSERISEKAFTAMMGIYTMMLSDGFESEEYRNILLNRSEEYRRGFSLAGASGKWKTLIFSSALVLPALYKFFVRLFHRRY